MKYSNDVVEKVVDSLASGRVIEQMLGICMKTVYRWRNRLKNGLPARFKRAAKQVWNKTSKRLLRKLKRLLKQWGSTILAWTEHGKLCLRTVQRYKKTMVSCTT